MELWGADESELKKQIVCLFCPVPGSNMSAFKRVTVSAGSGSKQVGWGHVLCALELQKYGMHLGATIDASGMSETWENVDCHTATCALCSLEGVGACVGCAHPNCQIWAHASCAASPFAESAGYSCIDGNLLCPIHESYALPETGAFSASAIASAAAAAVTPEPVKEMRPNPSWLNRRVSIIKEERIGTVVRILNKRLYVKLDDGVTEMEKKVEELFLLKKRPPGCAICSSSKNLNEILLCDGCDAEMHMKCLTPPITRVPKGKWFCPDCVQRKIEITDVALRAATVAAKSAALPKRAVPMLEKIKPKWVPIPPPLPTIILKPPIVIQIPKSAEARHKAAVAALAKSITNAGARAALANSSHAGGTSAAAAAAASGYTAAAVDVKRVVRKSKPVDYEGEDSELETMNDEMTDDFEEAEDDLDDGTRRKRRKKLNASNGNNGDARKRSSGSHPLLGLRRETSSGSLGGQYGMDWSLLFPAELCTSDWATMFSTTFRIQRAQAMWQLSQFPQLREIANQLRDSKHFPSLITHMLRAKIQGGEVPPACVPGFVLSMNRTRWTEEEIACLHEVCPVDQLDDMTLTSCEDYELPDGEFVLPTQPWIREAQHPGIPFIQIKPAGVILAEMQMARLMAVNCTKTKLISFSAEAVFDACSVALQSVNLEVRQAFLDVFRSLISRLSEDSTKMLERGTNGPLKWALTVLKPFVEHQAKKVRADHPMAKGEWRKTPYPRRAYEIVSDYEPVEIPGEMGENEKQLMLAKMITTKISTCTDESALVTHCHQPAPYSLTLGGFDTDRPCLSRRVGCPFSTIGKHEPMVMGRDIGEYDSWGIDGATRMSLDFVLRSMGSVTSASARAAIVEGLLLKCANTPRNAANAFDMRRAVDLVLESLESTTKDGDQPPLSAAMHTIWVSDALSYAGRVSSTTKDGDLVNGIQSNHNVEIGEDGEPNESSNHAGAAHTIGLPLTPLDIARGAECLRLVSRAYEFEIRPKGVGVQCLTKSGIPAGAFISRYLGELYTPWRWFERQDGVKVAQTKANFKPALPDFYNIMLERHEDDAAGYDVLFVDPIVRGNFASRLCHSCDPNCATVVMAVNGKFVIAVYALREISFGEELTFDYSSVTEDESEFRAAICLCGSDKCRGSFLSYAGAGAFASVITTHHTFLDRVAMLLLACRSGEENLTEEENECLFSNGIRDSVLRDLPIWMHRWASYVFGFVQFETQLLVADLLQSNPMYNESSAQLEAKGVAENRRQNVCISANKIGYFLRNAKSRGPPLVPLTDAQIVEYLWSGPQSVARRAIAGLAGISNKSSAFATALKWCTAAMDNPLSKNTVAEVKSRLEALRNMLWACTENNTRPYCESCGDVLTMYLMTSNWFAISKFEGFKSPPVAIRNVDIGRDAAATSGGNTSSSVLTSVGSSLENGQAMLDAAGNLRLNRNPYHFECLKEHVFSIRRSPKLGREDPQRYWTLSRQEIEHDAAMDLQSTGQDTFMAFSIPVPETVPYYVYHVVAETVCAKDGDRMVECLSVLDTVLDAVTLDHSYEELNHTFPRSSNETVSDTDRFDCDVVSRTPLNASCFVLKFVFYAYPAPSFREGFLAVTLPFACVDNSDILLSVLNEDILRRVEFGAMTAPGSKAPIRSGPMAIVMNEPKKYQAGFVWGQSVGWFKQTVGDPSAALSAERRGSLTLPDIETCFTHGANNDDFLKYRKDMLRKLRDKPDGMWPVSWPYSFKNEEKIYGSPWFDDALETAENGKFERVTRRSIEFIQCVNARFGGYTKKT